MDCWSKLRLRLPNSAFLTGGKAIRTPPQVFRQPPSVRGRFSFSVNHRTLTWHERRHAGQMDEETKPSRKSVET